MMEIEDVVLAVADPETSARFYAGLLGCRPLMAGPDRALFVLNSGRAFGLLRRAGDEGEVCEIDFPVQGAAAVDETHIDWWDRGARILTPPIAEAPVRSFVAGDPDGHRLRVYAVDA
jgi:catechol 2,3-dioxygenase-like lactoylglutathione lyase family enzyme